MAFTLTWDEVVLIAPDLASLTVDQQNAILADVELQVSESAFGAKYNLACKYLAAHLGTLYRRGAEGASGPVASERVGSVSRTYAVAKSAATGFGATAYGVQFEALARQLPIRAGAVL